MLATAAFLAFWVVVGLVLFFIALRGGPRGARATLQSQSRRSRRTAAVVFAVFFVAVGVAVPTLILLGDHQSASAHVDGATVRLTAQEQDAGSSASAARAATRSRPRTPSARSARTSTSSDRRRR